MSLYHKTYLTAYLSFIFLLSLCREWMFSTLAFSSWPEYKAEQRFNVVLTKACSGLVLTGGLSNAWHWCSSPEPVCSGPARSKRSGDCELIFLPSAPFWIERGRDTSAIEISEAHCERRTRIFTSRQTMTLPMTFLWTNIYSREIQHNQFTISVTCEGAAI